MIVLDKDKLSSFFESVSSGFVQSPLEILIVILLLIGFFGFLLLMYRIQKKRAKRKLFKQSQEKFERLVKKFDINPSEQALIRKLADFLKKPEKEYLLLLNQATFNSSVNKLKAKEELPAVAVTGLRLKLGFSAQDPEKRPSSSAELPQGMGVIIITEGGKKYPGKVTDCQAQSLAVHLEDPTAPISRGNPVTLYFQNRSGIFAFTTFVQERKGTAVYLDHSDKIVRHQRRKYYRKRLLLPLFIKPAGSEEVPVRSIMLDLGGGGASLKNPYARFKSGDDLELSFHPAGEKQFFILTEVLRVSKNGKILHVRFGPLKETTRDRIIGFLFRRKA